jgi:hypothetical protein
MNKSTTTSQSLLKLIQERQTAIHKTDEQLSVELGFERSDAFVMIKRGVMNLPLTLVPALAVALNIEPGNLLRIAMQESIPEVLKLVDDLLKPESLTSTEHRLIREIRRLSAGCKVNPIVFSGTSVVALVTS